MRERAREKENMGNGAKNGKDCRQYSLLVGLVCFIDFPRVVLLLLLIPSPTPTHLGHLQRMYSAPEFRVKIRLQAILVILIEGSCSMFGIYALLGAICANYANKSCH